LARGFDLIQRSQNLSTKEPSEARQTAEGCPQGSEAHQWGQENDFSDSFVPILLSKKPP
jgi:hypothetical protein